jgi:hypothetical protein
MASDLLSRILDRYDPAAFDVPNGHPRVRLVVDAGSGGEWCWDVVLGEHGARLLPADARGRPDALLAADLATWRHIAEDVRAGLPRCRRRSAPSPSTCQVSATPPNRFGPRMTPRSSRVPWSTCSTRCGYRASTSSVTASAAGWRSR